ncbi:hypothetical protein V5O48_009830 [Marasmius crinis-equi]|uniref:U1-type domain-containing protein n=1 Tax=Marasmius crinis-equi TaxID=585013 RepID=A0ABR3F9Z5_9AGAR
MPVKDRESHLQGRRHRKADAAKPSSPTPTKPAKPSRVWTCEGCDRVTSPHCRQHLQRGSHKTFIREISPEAKGVETRGDVDGKSDRHGRGGDVKGGGSGGRECGSGPCKSKPPSHGGEEKNGNGKRGVVGGKKSDLMLSAPLPVSFTSLFAHFNFIFREFLRPLIQRAQIPSHTTCITTATNQTAIAAIVNRLATKVFRGNPSSPGRPGIRPSLPYPANEMRLYTSAAQSNPAKHRFLTTHPPFPPPHDPQQSSTMAGLPRFGTRILGRRSIRAIQLATRIWGV